MARARPGWYRDDAAGLRYWNGRSWTGEAGLLTQIGRGGLWYSFAASLGWFAAMACLGLLLTNAHAAGVDCGTVFSPVAMTDSPMVAACAAALAARAKIAAAMGVLSVGGFGVAAATGS